MQPQAAEELDRVEEIVASYSTDERFALAILQEIQREFNYIPRGSLHLVHRHIGAPEAQLYAMATFYKALSLEPKGRHIIKVCDGTACHMRGMFTLVKGIETVLSIQPGQTTVDGLFSLELVNCLGSCALAPVMLIDETYYSQVSMDKLTAILNDVRLEGARDE